MVYVNHNLVGFDFGSAAACQWNIAYRLAGERTASDPMPCVVYKHICIDHGLLSPALFFGFLLCSCPCPVCSLSSFIVHSANLAFLTCPCLSRFFFVVCFGAFISFSTLPQAFQNPNDQIPSTTMGLGFLAVDIMIRVV